MKFKSTISITVNTILFSSLFLIHTGLNAQGKSLTETIEKHRMGELVVRTEPGAKIEIEQLSHEFWFGCAISSNIFNGRISGDDQVMYKKKFLENFNSAVTENAVKWGSMEHRKGEVNYSTVDNILEWTEENDIPLRAHNLFWGIPKFVQPWVKELDDKELEETLRNRAITFTSKYMGRFVEYDLNNEMIHGNYYEDRLGEDITLKMAQWAYEGDPGITLYLNDYNILTGRNLDEFLAHIRKLQEDGVPVSGIGVQGHLHSSTFDREVLKQSLDSLAQFNLPIRITEFNVPGQTSDFYRERVKRLSDGEAEINARELTDYYTICFAHPSVEGILMWGFWEGANWIPASSMYNKDWTLNKTGEAYQDLVFNKWWTKENGITGTKGEFKIPAFYGKYKITVEGETVIIDHRKADEKTVVEL